MFVSCRESNNDPRSKNASFCSFARLGMQFVRLPFACVIPNYFPFNSWELNHSILTRLESPTQYSNKTLRAQPQYSKALHSGYGKKEHATPPSRDYPPLQARRVLAAHVQNKKHRARNSLVLHEHVLTTLTSSTSVGVVEWNGISRKVWKTSMEVSGTMSLILEKHY